MVPGDRSTLYSVMYSHARCHRCHFTTCTKHDSGLQKITPDLTSPNSVSSGCRRVQNAPPCGHRRRYVSGVSDEFLQSNRKVTFGIVKYTVISVELSRLLTDSGQLIDAGL